MREFEIWSEGYAATGEHQPAVFEGKVTAETFDQAVINLLGHRLDKDADQPDGYRRRSGRLCIWACEIFDNEADARKSFG